MSLPIEPKYILETEKELQIEFPMRFKAKMQIENGGEVIAEDEDWQLFPFFDNQIIKGLAERVIILFWKLRRPKVGTTFQAMELQLHQMDQATCWY